MRRNVVLRRQLITEQVPGERNTGLGYLGVNQVDDAISPTDLHATTKLTERDDLIAFHDDVFGGASHRRSTKVFNHGVVVAGEAK